MLFRQAALVVLAGVLPLAAAGTLAPATRAWFSRTTGWMLALIFYKPAAAAVYATCFALIGSGNDPRTTLMGFAMLLLSLLALPALMKFFTWTTGTVEAPVGGGFLSTVVSGAIAVGAVRGSAGGAGGASAVDQARMVSAQLGSPEWRPPRRTTGRGQPPALAAARVAVRPRPVLPVRRPAAAGDTGAPAGATTGGCTQGPAAAGAAPGSSAGATARPRPARQRAAAPPQAQQASGAAAGGRIARRQRPQPGPPRPGRHGRDGAGQRRGKAGRRQRIHATTGRSTSNDH